MAKLNVTPAARADMVEIDEWGYQQFGEKVADNYSRQLLSAFDQLADHPLSGKQCRIWQDVSLPRAPQAPHLLCCGAGFGSVCQDFASCNGSGAGVEGGVGT